MANSCVFRPRISLANKGATNGSIDFPDATSSFTEYDKQ